MGYRSLRKRNEVEWAKNNRKQKKSAENNTNLLNGRFDKVMHRLPVRAWGHSYWPCDRDRDFGVIEKLQRKREVVELPLQKNTIQIPLMVLGGIMANGI